MRTHILMLALGLLPATTLSAPAWAADGAGGSAVASTRLEGLTPEAAQALIGKLQGAQEDLRQGKVSTFALLSGAPASFKQASMSPRDAFLGLSFARPFAIRMLAPDSTSRLRSYRLELLPDGPGQIVCDVEVTLGFGGEITRVQLYYRPPAPF